MIAASGGVRWLAQLGGPGLILLGLADNSVIPLPGSMDVLTIWLAAGHPHLWLYYAGMATVGAALGGYITYRIARKGGKAALEAKFRKQKIEKVYAQFERWGFGAVAIPALLPPPFPMVPVLLAAGALQYSRKKFIAALALGRGVRFAIVAFLGAHYGQHVTQFFQRYYKPALAILIAAVVVGGLLALREYLRRRKQSGAESTRHARSRAA